MAWSCVRGVLAAGAMSATLCQAQMVAQTPQPTGRNLEGVAFTSPTHGFVAGQNHHLLETFDGGRSWITRMATGYSSDPFYTVTFFDALHGYVAGNNQDAYRTTDGGATWLPMPNMIAGSGRVFSFVSPTRGFYGVNGAIAFTPDGGQSWEVRSGFPDSPIFYDMSFTDENVGVATGHRSTPYHDGGVYRTVDGGRTWTLANSGGGALVRLDSVTLVCVAGTDVLRSDDDGQSWYTISSGVVLTGLSSIDRAGNSDTLLGVSFGGDIWRSTDLGYSWQQMVVGIGVLPAIWEIDAFDAQHAWVVGSSGLTYGTTDGGESWTLLNSGCGDEVTAIDFADDDFGIAVTYHGFVFRTLDRGGRWDVTRLRESGEIFGRHEGLNAVDVVNQNMVVVGGAGGLLFRSDDGGANWDSLGYPWGLPSLEIEALKFTDSANGWLGCIGEVQGLYRTTDGGFSWTPVEGVTGSIVAIDVRGERVWAITAGDRIYRSTDGGQTFSAMTMPGQVNYLNDIEFVDENNGFAVGWYGYMARTTNGGATWTPFAYPQDETYFQVQMNSPTDVMVAGRDNDPYGYFYLRSTNGGNTWTRTNLNAQFEDWFSVMHWRPSGRFWLGGQAGRIVYHPAPPLTLTLPNDVPPQVTPGEINRIPVRITAGEEQLAAGSATLWVRRSAAAQFETVALEQIGTEDFLAPLPGFDCTDTPQFYVSVGGDGGSTVRYPAGAPGSLLTTRVGVIENADLLRTEFDSGLPAGWAASGLWHATSTACLPTGACGGGTWLYFGQDAVCTFNTGARVTGTVRSPTFALPALQAGQHITLTFCSALDTEYADGAYGDDDTAQVWWVRSSGQQNPIHWFTDHRSARTQTFSLDAYAGTTGRLEWRFDSMNTYMNDFRGWHIDNVRVIGPTLVCEDAGRDGDLDGDGDVDLADLATVLAAFGTCAGDAAFNANADINHSACVDLADLASLLANFGA